MSERDMKPVSDPDVKGPGDHEAHEAAKLVAPTTLLKPPSTAGLNMVAGEQVGICEGDVCFVPSLVRNEEDAG